LGREPDIAELNEYVREIASARDVSTILRAFADSREAWERNLYRHPDYLVRTVFAGLLKRAPDTKAASHYSGTLTRTQDLGALIQAIDESQEHWENTLRHRSEELTRIAYNSLVHREPDSQELVSQAARLVGTRDLAALLTDLSHSSEHWETLIERRAESLVTALYRGILKREPDPKALRHYSSKLAQTHDLESLLRVLSNSPEHWGNSLAAHSTELAVDVYQGMMGCEPVPQNLLPYANDFRVTRSLVSLIAQIAKSSDYSKKLSDERSTGLVIALFRGLLGRDPEPEAVQSYGQQLMQGRPVDWLVAAVAGSEEHENHLLNSNWHRQCNRVYRAFLQRPASGRELALWSSVRNVCSNQEHTRLIIQSLIIQFLKRQLKKPALLGKTKPVKPNIIFAYDAKKERDSLFPLFDKLCHEDDKFSNVVLLDTAAAIDFYIDNISAKHIIVTSIEGCHRKIKAVGLEGIFIYMEHGVAPLKRYTYAGHYRKFDYSFLPGNLWCDRLKKLYPELTDARLFTVGYPKLSVKNVSPSENKAYRERFGLRLEGKIVLFAPTWSGGDAELGISNIRYFDGVRNYIAIPHDGDIVLAKTLKERGLPVHIMADGESISEHYAYADVLVTDISSTAIEFSRIGKPVICLKTPSFPDFDPAYIDSDGIPSIPHTENRWDFCPVIDRASIASEVKLLVARLEAGEWSAGENHLVTQMCAYFGDEAVERSRWALNQVLEQNKNSGYLP
jgi:hypothetical protein